MPRGPTSGTDHFREATFAGNGVDCFGPFRVFETQSNEEIWLSLYVFQLQSSTYKTSFFRYRCFPQCSNQVFCTTGTPEKIISDNGTTFARVNKELQEAFASWGAGSSLDKLLQRKGIKWGFSFAYWKCLGKADTVRLKGPFLHHWPSRDR